MNQYISNPFRWIAILVCLIALSPVTNTHARSFRVGMVPNGTKFSCNTCHTSGGGTPRNAFGLAVQARVTPNGSQVFWDASLADLDSDGDNISNGDELGDPDGDFLNVGPVADVTAPGFFDNTAPQISGTPSTVGFFGESYSATFSQFDLNGHGVTFTKVSGPDWLIVAGNGLVSGIPPEGPLETVNVTIRATDDYSNPLSVDEMFAISLSASFVGWQNLQFDLPGEAAIAGADQDSDNDDLPNIVEYALRNNPKQTDATSVPGPPSFDGSSRMQFVLQVRDDDSNLSIQLEVSDDVPFTAPSSINPVVTDPNGSDGLETWTFTDTVSSDSIMKRFGQLKFQLPE